MSTRRVAGVVTVVALAAGSLAAAGSASATDLPAGQLGMVAGTGAAAAPTPGAATSSALDEPTGVAVDGSGNVYIADYDNNEVEEESAGTLTVIAGTGSYGGPTTGPATGSELAQPTGVAVDSYGNVYIADSGNNEIEEVIASTGDLSVIAGTGSSGTPTAGTATSSDLDDPTGVAVDSSGDVYIADSGNNEIEEVSSGDLSVVAGTGSSGTPTTGTATTSDLDGPTGVAVDSSGNVYIADFGNDEVEEVSSGDLSVIAGTGSSGAPTGGTATSSDMNFPYGVAVDGLGNVYVADSGNNEIEEVSSGDLSVIAGTGTSGTPTTGIAATGSDLHYPTGVAVDVWGNVDIADQTNNLVEQVAGSSVTPVFTADAPPPAAFESPYDYTFTASGNPAPVFAVASGTLPAGLTLDPASGELSGRPTATGESTFTVSATNIVTTVTSAPIEITTSAPMVGITHPPAGGYLTVNEAGSVYTHSTPFLGSPHAKGIELTSPVVGIAAEADGGYLVATAGGNVYNYGTAFHGSPASSHVAPTSSVVGIAAEADGGYVLVTAGGNVYNYGTAFHGSPATSSLGLTSVVGVTATADGGYLLVSAAGNIYNYGTKWLGSPAAQGLPLTTVVGIAAETDGGYVVAAADGSVYNYKTAWVGSPHAGSIALHSPVMGITNGASSGYTLATSGGATFSYGLGQG